MTPASEREFIAFSFPIVELGSRSGLGGAVAPAGLERGTSGREMRVVEQIGAGLQELQNTQKGL